MDATHLFSLMQAVEYSRDHDLPHLVAYTRAQLEYGYPCRMWSLPRLEEAAVWLASDSSIIPVLNATMLAIRNTTWAGWWIGIAQAIRNTKKVSRIAQVVLAQTDLAAWDGHYAKFDLRKDPIVQGTFRRLPRISKLDGIDLDGASLDHSFLFAVQ